MKEKMDEERQDKQKKWATSRDAPQGDGRCQIDITYTHQNKFTEVENIALWVKADSLISKTLLCNLHLNSKAKRGRIFKESRKSATPESLTDMPRPILRTALEERIVAEAKEEHKEQ